MQKQFSNDWIHSLGDRVCCWRPDLWCGIPWSGSGDASQSFCWLYTAREASVFIKNDELAKKLGTHFLDECEASQRSVTSEVKVTCYGFF